MTLNGVIALILYFSPNSIALLANDVTVVEDGPIMSAKYCLSIPVFHFCPKLTHPAARSLCDTDPSLRGEVTLRQRTRAPHLWEASGNFCQFILSVSTCNRVNSCHLSRCKEAGYTVDETVLLFGLWSINMSSFHFLHNSVKNHHHHHHHLYHHYLRTFNKNDLILVFLVQ